MGLSTRWIIISLKTIVNMYLSFTEKFVKLVKYRIYFFYP